MNLKQFIMSEAGKPFALGANDCAHFVARWVAMQTKKDGLEPFNGLDAHLAHHLVESGKLASSFAIGCKAAGLKRLDKSTVQAGDVGVIRRETRIQCAIKSNSGWVYFGEKGIGMEKNAKVIAAWEVHPCQQ